MSTALRLPPALLDLTLSRVYARAPLVAVRPWRGGCEAMLKRHSHGAAALAHQTPLDHADYGALSYYSAREEKKESMEPTDISFLQGFQTQDRALSELEERVRMLQEVVKDQTSLVNSLESASYSEEDLLRVYEDVLTLPAPQTSEQPGVIDPQAQVQEDAILLRGIASRWLDSSEAVASSSSDSGVVLRSVIGRLREVAGGLEPLSYALPTITGEGAETEKTFLSVPTGILTKEEWLALVRTSLRIVDGETAEGALNLMKATGGLGLEEAVNEVLASYASAGNVTGAERVLQAFAPSPTETQRDYHVKAYCKASSPGAFPLHVEKLLHDYEARGLPAPMKTYARVLQTLLSTRTRPSLGHAQALDLFAHMRYAVHPKPDIGLYTLMIRSCAHPAMPAEPERALDLLTEATVDQKLAPTSATFSAVIYALSRSGEKRYVREAFRLAKQIVDGNRDARGMSAFRPDRRLVDALLEGAKRVGDLSRTRWLLAIMVRETAKADARVTEGASAFESPESLSVMLDEGIMRHIFHAYASFKVPFTPTLAKIVEEPDANAAGVASSSSATAHEEATDTSSVEVASDMEEDFASSGLPAERDESSFSLLPPQSRSEVTREVDILFARIIEDSKLKYDSTTDANTAEDTRSSLPGPFQHVALTSRLLNAYLSVHYVHSNFEVWCELYRTLFERLDVPRDAKTYVEALERCAISHRSERHLALRLAEEIWGSWQSVEGAWATDGASGSNDPAVSTLNARLVERANAAMIRMLSLTGQTRRALDLVQSFAARYPPAQLLRVEPKHPLRSSRVILEGVRPLVRLANPVDIPDDTVPPLLTFTDLGVLHARLVRNDDRTGIRYLKWLSKSYEGNLRRRRDATMTAASREQKSSTEASRP